jgi:hypothetical protein
LRNQDVRGFFLFPTNPPKAEQQRSKAMLKSTYDKLDDIPEADRPHYALRKGKYVLELDDHHPVLAKNRELVTKQTTDQRTITRLTNEKQALESNVLPEGHKAVSEEDARFIEEVKPLSLSPKDLKTIVGEHKTLKEESEGRRQDEIFERAAKDMGYENAATFKAMAKALKLDIKYKTEKVDGQDVEKPYVGDKSLADHINATPELKASEPAFKARPAAQPPSTEAGAGTRPATSAAAASAGKQEPYRFQEPGDVAWPT